MTISTTCAICKTFGNSTKIYDSTIDESTFSVEVFSARRLPDRRHYQWVTCNACGLFRSDPIQDIDLFNLYKESTFDYSNELHGLSNSYRKLLEKTDGNFEGKSLLELGGGNGFFLLEAKKLGFKNLIEIEPSISARANADASIQNSFISEMLSPNLIKQGTQDYIAAFHVLDHLPNPSESVQILKSFLKERGYLIVAVHNVRSISATLLKNRSPIFDVEHTYLFSKETLRLLLLEAGFSNIVIKHYKNSYSLAYILHLLPMPSAIKSKILDSNLSALLRKIKITVPLGNIYAIASK